MGDGGGVADVVVRVDEGEGGEGGAVATHDGEHLPVGVGHGAVVEGEAEGAEALGGGAGGGAQSGGMAREEGGRGARDGHETRLQCDGVDLLAHRLAEQRQQPLRALRQRERVADAQQPQHARQQRVGQLAQARPAVRAAHDGGGNGGRRRQWRPEAVRPTAAMLKTAWRRTAFLFCY